MRKFRPKDERAWPGILIPGHARLRDALRSYRGVNINTCTSAGGCGDGSTIGDGLIPIPSGVIFRRGKVPSLCTSHPFR